MVIYKNTSKLWKFCVFQVPFFSLKFVVIVFVSSLHDSITLSHITAEPSRILAKHFQFSQLHVAGFQTQTFSYTRCFLHSHGHLLLFHHWSELHFLPSNLHLHLHDICFVNIFYSFIPVIMLSTLRFKFSVLFGGHTLLDKLLRVLQLITHLSNLTTNG